MKGPLVIVLVAVVLVAVSTLVIMNNACKSSQHAWCAPTSVRHHTIARTVKVEVQRHSPVAKEVSPAKDASPVAKEASPAKDVSSFVATAKADTKKSKHYKPKVFAYKPKVLARQRNNLLWERAGLCPRMGTDQGVFFLVIRRMDDSPLSGRPDRSHARAR
jgi:hypothetical protein